jgi:hypothetical protein
VITVTVGKDVAPETSPRARLVAPSKLPAPSLKVKADDQHEQPKVMKHFSRKEKMADMAQVRCPRAD